MVFDSRADRVFSGVAFSGVLSSRPGVLNFEVDYLANEMLFGIELLLDFVSSGSSFFTSVSYKNSTSDANCFNPSLPCL